MQQLSEDGKWKWDGSEWVPNEGADETPSSAVADIPVAAAPIASQEPVQATTPMAQVQPITGESGQYKLQNTGCFSRNSSASF